MISVLIFTVIFNGGQEAKGEKNIYSDCSFIKPLKILHL